MRSFSNHVSVGLLCLGLLAGCATAATPQTQTVPTESRLRAGADYKVNVGGWNSVASVEEKARFGDEATRNNETTLEVPMRDAEGKVILDGNGNPVMVRYKGTGLRDVYVISSAGTGIDAHIEVQPGATSTGTGTTTGSGTADKQDTIDQKPEGTLTVPLSGAGTGQ